MRLRRSNPTAPGYGRRRRGRGFSYQDTTGAPLRDPQDVRRIQALRIPPAWRGVWICPDPSGHIQATGTDAAGRRQYLYHPDWRRRRDRRKFEHVLEIAGRLPRLRRVLRSHLSDPGLSRRRVLAAAVRLIDLGLFRVGNDQYANASYGLSTLRAEHVRVGTDGAHFRYRAKGGIEREVTVRDRQVVAVLRALRSRRRGRARLLAYRSRTGWHEVHSDDINEYLREVAGCAMTAKDFRTWHATVLAAVALARVPDQGRRSRTSLRRSVAGAMREVSSELGNTAAVVRSSYVDPRVLDKFGEGQTIPESIQEPGPSAERAVLDLLAD
ncbi:MAG: topoisomerase [Micromonosporaceae bacterium]